MFGNKTYILTAALTFPPDELVTPTQLFELSNWGFLFEVQIFHCVE